MILAHTPGAIFARWLVTNNFGVLSTATIPPDWTITVDALPAEQPDNRIALFNVGQYSKGRLMSGEILEDPVLQIRTRSRSNQTGWVKLAGIQEAFELIKPSLRPTISMTSPTRDYWLEAVHVQIPIMNLPQVEEENKRFNFVQTIRLVFGEQ